MMWTFVATVFSKATIADWLVLSVALLLLLYIWGTWNYDYFHKRGIHYIKPKLPFVGNTNSTLLFLDSIPNLIKRTYDMGKGHGVLGLFEFRVPSFMIRDPELLKIVAVKDFDHFVNRRTFDMENIEPLFSKNLANLKDDQWRRMRVILSPAFTTSKIKAMFPLISQCAEQMTEHLSSKYSQSEEGRNRVPMEVEMKDVCSRMANDVIASVAFGVQCDSLKERDNQFHKMGKRLTTFSSLQTLKFVALLVAPKLMDKFGMRFLNAEAVDFFDSLVRETTSERQKNGIFRPDVLQLLMQARQGELQAEPEDEAADEEKIGSWKSKLGDDEISAQAIIFFFGGFETVSTTLCLVTYALSFHQQEQKRLQREIDEVFRTTDDNLTYEAVQGMKYLDAFINETMRMYPTAAATDRQCNEDTVLPATDTSVAIHIPKGTVISIPIIGIHHDPEFWNDPMTFDPDRFLDENKHSIKPFTFMPFGVGPRICIAQRFALLEMKLALVSLLRKFDLFPSPKLKYPLEYKKGFVLSPVGGFLCCLKPR